MIGRSFCSVRFLFPVTLYKVHLLHVCWYYLCFLNVWCSTFLKIIVNFVFVFKKVLILNKILILDCSNSHKIGTLSKKSSMTVCGFSVIGELKIAWVDKFNVLWTCEYVLKVLNIIIFKLLVTCGNSLFYFTTLEWIYSQDGSSKQCILRAIWL